MEGLEVMSVGSANMDLVVRTHRFPASGETVQGLGFGTFTGGKGANQAAAAGRLGARVGLVAKVGADGFGQELIDSLRSVGVDTRTVLRDASEATGTALITVDAEGQNTIVVSPGTNALLRPREVEAALKGAEFQVLLVQLEIPVDSVAAAASFAPGHTLILNPAPANTVPDEVLCAVNYLTPNETEAEFLTAIALTDESSCLRAAAKLLDKGVKNVLFTLGARGSFLANTSGGRHFPALVVRAIDTTGAGDAFNGALALFLSRGQPVPNAIRLANIAGALCATKMGAQAAMPTLEEVQALAAQSS